MKKINNCNGLVCYIEGTIDYVYELKGCTKSQVREYKKEFLDHCDKFDGKITHEYFKETHAWEYIIKCINSVENKEDEEVDIKILDKYDAFCYVLNKYEIFDQIVNIVERLRGGEESKMTLFGLPVAIKDNLAVKDIPFTNGATTGPYKSSYNGTVLEKFIERGIIIVGKTKLNGFGVGSNTSNVKSPYGEEYIVGGSSGGSGAAVRGNIVTCALGTDTGGSVRCPAAFASSVGYRPSYGAISRFGMSELCGRFDTIGFITSNLYQALYFAYVSMGYDPKDMYSRPESEEVKDLMLKLLNKYNHPKRSLDGANPLENVKIGMFDAEKICKLGYIDEENKKNMQNVERITRSLGAEIVIVDELELKECTALYYLYTAKNVSTNLRRFSNYPYQKTQESTREDFITNLDQRISERFLLGEYVKMVGFDVEMFLKEVRGKLLKWIEKNKMFKEVEFLISPTTSEVLPLNNEEFMSKNVYMLDMFLTTSSIMGLCSIALPLRNSERPNSFQITAGYLQDDKLFEISSIFKEYLNI